MVQEGVLKLFWFAEKQIYINLNRGSPNNLAPVYRLRMTDYKLVTSYDYSGFADSSYSILIYKFRAATICLPKNYDLATDLYWIKSSS